MDDPDGLGPWLDHGWSNHGPTMVPTTSPAHQLTSSPAPMAQTLDPWSRDPGSMAQAPDPGSRALIQCIIRGFSPWACIYSVNTLYLWGGPGRGLKTPKIGVFGPFLDHFWAQIYTLRPQIWPKPVQKWGQKPTFWPILGPLFEALFSALARPGKVRFGSNMNYRGF